MKEFRDGEESPYSTFISLHKWLSTYLTLDDS